MQLKVTSLDNKEVGSIDLADEVFGLEHVRRDILARMVNCHSDLRAERGR